MVRILRAKYFPNTRFLSAQLGSKPSLVWRGIWSARKLIEMGLKWNVGIGESINIWEDCWVPRSLPGKVQTSRSSNIERVSELILPNGMGWNRDLIDLLFVVADAILIQATRSCLYNRRVANNLSYPRCNVDYETVNHVLRFCAKAKDVWVMLGYPLHVVSAQMDFHEWLSWILKIHHTTKHNEICVTMWAIWFARNRMVHEGTNQSVREIVSFICNYCVELVSMIHTNNGVVSDVQVRWSLPPAGVVKINVDAGFRLNQKKAAAGVVIRDENGEILRACCKITYLVLSSAKEIAKEFHACAFHFIGQSGNKTTHAMAQNGIKSR
ncbi:hypothetical protein GOBAR_DD05379 [Gossypium barbadense]|nr:hypothetical protein GOBAR_DD05379 [Gossypium barbadense]